MELTHSDDAARRRVATNVRLYRQARRLTLEELSARCATEAGLPISAAALLLVEQGKRGVEAGDLVGLAVALEIRVPDLLSPSVDEGQDDVQIGEARTMSQPDYLGVIGAPGRVGTGNAASLRAIATAAGEDARRPGRTSAALRQAGFTTEQLRDRFGPPVAFADTAD